MKFLIHLSVSAFLLTTTLVSAQVFSGGAVTLDCVAGQGKWTPYEHIISEYFKAYPWMKDTGNIAPQKFGISCGVTVVEDRLMVGGRYGGFRSMAWANGDSVSNDWAENILVNCKYTDVFVGYFFVQKPWFRMGVTAGLSINFIKMKSERSDELLQKSKDGGWFFLNPGNSTNFENKMFGSLKVGLPIAFGRRIAFSLEPFYSLPLWKVNTSEIRLELIPNSTPAAEKSYYKGVIGYAGIRIALNIGTEWKD